MQTTGRNINSGRHRTAATNSTYKKLAVQWLNEALCFVSSSVVADSFRLRNRQLLVAANRYGQGYETPQRKRKDKRTTLGKTFGRF
jgi:hypothetical protein